MQLGPSSADSARPVASSQALARTPRDRRVHQSSYILFWLVVVVLAVVVPLVGLQIYTVAKNRQSSERAAYAQVSSRASEIGSRVNESLTGVEQLLIFLSTRLELQSLDGAGCRSLLEKAPSSGSIRFELGLVDMSGELVCASTPRVGPSNVASTAWFKSAITAGGFQLSDPFIGRDTDRHVSVMTLPVLQGEIQVGVVAAVIDLLSLNGILNVAGLPEQSTIAMGKRGSVFMLRIPAPERYIGKMLPATVGPAALLADGSIYVTEGPDGIERAYAASTLGRYDLRLAVGAPTQSLKAQATRDAQLQLAAALAITLIGLLAAFVCSRKLAAPLNSLLTTIRRLAAGEVDERAEEGLPGEFGEMAAALNHLKDVQEASASETKRLMNFYEALSQAHRSAASGEDRQQSLCRLCQSLVDDAVLVAVIGVRSGDGMRLTAGAGPHQQAPTRVLEGLDVTLGSALAELALKDGVAVTETGSDSSAAIARLFGVERDAVKAAAAFPLQGQSEDCAVLMLLASEPGHFDPRRMHRYEMLARDIPLHLP